MTTELLQQIDAVKARLQQMDPDEQQAAYSRLLADLAGLEEQRRALGVGGEAP